MAVIPDLRDWIPYRVDLRAEVPELHWCHTAGERLTEPFFDGDLTRLMARPFNRTFDVVTTMDDTAAHLAANPPLRPTAFIFHVGRCGSTLVSRLLAADPRNRVLSEPAPLDTVLRAPLTRAGVGRDQYHGWLRTTLGALAQPAAGETRVFVKLDSWASAAAAELDLAFPDVPWLFLYRDPVEVMVSLEALKPMTLLPSVLGPDIFGIPWGEALRLPEDEYAARVLGVLTGNLATWSHRAWLMEYPELPGALDVWLAEILDIHPGAETQRAMREVTTRHAKHPDAAFTDDRSTKQHRATPEMRELIDRWVAPAYEHLRDARTTRRPT